MTQPTAKMKNSLLEYDDTKAVKAPMSALTIHPSSSSSYPSKTIRHRINQNNTHPLAIKVDRGGGSDQQWELTWPIWHMLPRAERKEIASRYDMSIGEFEEYMSLERAVGISSDGDRLQDELVPSDEAACATRKIDGKIVELNDTHKGKFSGSNEGDKDEIEDDGYEFQVESDEKQCDKLVTNTQDQCSSVPATTSDHHVDRRNGGAMASSSIPEEVYHKIMSYLDTHAYATCALVHPAWASFTRTEYTYKVICQRCYMNQSKRKALNLSRWRSYKNMLTSRPRVRTGGGVYILKYSHAKKVHRDMWTEVPVGAILETVYYRYIVFLENGACMYALTPTSPYEMIPKFVQKLRLMSKANIQHGTSAILEENKTIVVGRYEVARDSVRVWAAHPWCHVAMEMKLLTNVEGAVDQEVPQGKFTMMSFVRHRSCPISSNFDDSCGIVEYKVPHEIFRFIRDRRL